MSEQQKIVFPLDVICQEFLAKRNQQAHDLVQEAVKLVALKVGVPSNLRVAPTNELDALVVVPEVSSQIPGPDLDRLEFERMGDEDAQGTDDEGGEAE